MITVTENSGVSFGVQSVKPISENSGVSFGSVDIFPVTENSGVSFGSIYDLKIRFFDSSNNQEIEASFFIINSTDNSDIYSNGQTEEQHEHRIILDFSSQLILDITSIGYLGKIENFAYNKTIQSQCLDIFLDPIPSISFNCQTFPINASGVPISVPITGSKIRVVFTASSGFDLNDYIISIEAFQKGSVITSVRELDYEITDSTTNTVTVDFDPVDSPLPYCYIPNITKKQC